MSRTEVEHPPTFTIKPRIREEDEGNRLLFECELNSIPRPDFVWYKDEELVVDDGYRFQLGIRETRPHHYLCWLELNDVIEIDEGNYRVLVKNLLGEVTASIRLNFDPVDSPEKHRQRDGISPTFEKKPAIRQAEDGRVLFFECLIQADPKPDVHWFHNNEQINLAGRFSATLELVPGGGGSVKGSRKGSRRSSGNGGGGQTYKSVFKITDVNVTDAGKYRVVAKNELGESNASISLNFDDDEKSNDSGAKPTFTEKPLIKQAEDGRRITFECRLVADPPPTVDWLQGRTPIKADGSSPRHQCSVSTDKHNHLATLTLLDVVAADAGLYTALARNRHGEAQATIELNFDEGRPAVPDAMAPRFPKKPTIRQKGNVLVLECLLEANPYPEITWYHGTKVITESARHKQTRQETGPNQYLLGLEIHGPTIEDGGTYRCNALNEKGESNANIALNFQSGDEDDNAPSFIGKPRIVPAETAITLECRVKSKTAITATWSKGGTTIRESGRHQLTIVKEKAEEYYVTLVIKNPSAADGGSYKGLIKNEAGEITANLSLNIEGEAEEEDGSIAPTFLAKPSITADEDGQHILMEVRCRAKPKPTITWFHEGELVRTGGRIRQTIIEEKGDVYVIRLEITGGDSPDSGLYKCNVKNSVGESNANLTLNIEIVPVISQRPRLVRLERQRKIVIECAVKSSNAPKVTWIRESTTVREDSRHRQIVKEERKGEYMIQLEIEEPTEGDKGAYKMRAVNEKGEVTSEVIRLTEIFEDEEKKEEEEKQAAKKKKTVSAPKILQELRSEKCEMNETIEFIVRSSSS